MSTKVKLVWEFVEAYRHQYHITPGTVQNGGDDFGEVEQLVESLAHTPDHEWEWGRLQSDAALLGRVLNFIAGHIESKSVVAARLARDYPRRLARLKR